MLNSKQRAQLRSLGNSLETIFQIGKGGKNDHLVTQIGEALEVRELVKVRVLESSPDPVREVAHEIARELSADVVQVIGSRFILYRESSENPQIKLVKTK